MNNNNVVLIGRINNDIEKIETENKTIYKLMLNISRNFKNQNGKYETDFIPIELFSGVGSTVFEYCSKNDLIAVRGRIECKKGQLIRVIAERVTFLSNNRKLVNQN